MASPLRPLLYGFASKRLGFGMPGSSINRRRPTEPSPANRTIAGQPNRRRPAEEVTRRRKLLCP